MKFSERFDIDKIHFESYETLDREPPIFKKEKHISNIINKFNAFFSNVFPHEIIYNICEYIFYGSKDINLKILNFLIDKNAGDDLLKKFSLTDNNNNHISSILFEMDYNTIFFKCHTSFDDYVGWCAQRSLNIFDYDIKNKNLMILTNVGSRQNYFEEILYDTEEINGENVVEKVETCLDYESITCPSEIERCYRRFPNYSFNRVYNDENIEDMGEYIYKLMQENSEIQDDNDMTALIFKNKVISFSCGWASGIVEIIEVKENGAIIRRNYDYMPEILKMERWNIEDIIKYNFTIKKNNQN